MKGKTMKVWLYAPIILSFILKFKFSIKNYTYSKLRIIISHVSPFS